MNSGRAIVFLVAERYPQEEESRAQRKILGFPNIKCLAEYC